jgi:hypothetical protein
VAALQLAAARPRAASSRPQEQAHWGLASAAEGAAAAAAAAVAAAIAGGVGRGRGVQYSPYSTALNGTRHSMSSSCCLVHGSSLVC